jgi:predicted membrane protein
MKTDTKSKPTGARVLVYTLFLVALSGVTLWTMTYSFSNLLKVFDILLLSLFVLSTYFTLVLVYSIVTIFYNVDKLKGRQKRTFKWLEIRTNKGGGER